MINIVLPKGSLEGPTLRLFAKAKLKVERSGSRVYSGKINDPGIGLVKFLRPQEIPLFVQEGYFDLGISGTDYILESKARVIRVSQLPYNRKTSQKPVLIVLAVSKDSPVNNPQQLNQNWRVSTEYPKITKNYFQKFGFMPKITYSCGATEAKIPEIADAIVDLVETGATLKKNNLKIIDVLLESQTELITNPAAFKDPIKKVIIERISKRLLKTSIEFKDTFIIR